MRWDWNRRPGPECGLDPSLTIVKGRSFIYGLIDDLQKTSNVAFVSENSTNNQIEGDNLECSYTKAAKVHSKYLIDKQK